MPGSSRHSHDSHATASPSPGYLPGLDGLRALAVLAVVLFHSAAGWPSAGFLGVEVFFVISGYIITRGLLTERREHGAISLGSFWGRRARRLLPALGLLLIGVLVFSEVFRPATVADLRADLLAALVYVSNWHLMAAGQDYFGSFAEPSLLKHLWSLAIEEQFYIVWPVVAFAGLRLMRPGRFAVAVLVLAALSTAWLAWLSFNGASISRMYYGTDTRMAGLLIGAALALTLPVGGIAGGRARPMLEAAGVAALMGLAAMIVFADGTGMFLYRGGLAVVAVLTAVAIAAATFPGSRLGSGLSAAPLRWGGTRSYAIYLWHWPVVLIIAPAGELNLGPAWANLAAQLAATAALAEVSYRLVEAPARRADWRRLLPAARSRLAASRLRAAGAAVGMGGALLSLGVVAAVAVTARPEAAPAYFTLERVRIASPPVGAEARALNLERPASFGGVSKVTVELEAAPSFFIAQPFCGSPSAELVCTAPLSEREALASANEVLARALAAAPAPEPEPEGPRQVTAIGDSVMLGAARQLAAAIPGIDVDAEVGRQVSEVIRILGQRAASGHLGDTILLHVGNNGTFTAPQFDSIMVAAGDRTVVFLNLVVPRSWENPNNTVIVEGVARYANAYLVDWRAASVEPGIFWRDGIHLRPEGAAIYVDLVLANLR